MTVRIAHLYNDLMNLYGDSGNVKALIKALESQGIEVHLEKISVDNEINFDEYDVFVIGSGTESNMLRCLHNLRMYKENVKNAIEKGKIFLCTGNAIEMFGKSITSMDGSLYNGIDMFNFEVVQKKDRLVSEYLYSCSLINKHVIGFQNRSGIIDNYEFNLFEIVRGIGNDGENKMEGIHYKNFFGTYTIGPLLVRNPAFLKYFVRLIVGNKSVILNDFPLELDEKAYDEFMNNHYPVYNIKKDF